MKLFEQALRIFIICLLGEIIVAVLGISFPGSIVAMIILFICLFFKLIKPKQIDNFSDFLLKNMVLFFITPTVSIISYVDVIQSILFKFLFICIITTVITFLATAYSVKLAMHIMNKFKGGEK